MAIFFGVTSVILLAGGGRLLVDNVWLSLTASFADEQTQSLKNGAKKP